MRIRNENDHEGLQIIGGIVADVLAALCAAATPGMTTEELDVLAGKLLFKNEADATPRKEYGFPGRLCVSVNDEVVHGVPGKRVLKPGDLIKMDLTADRRGFVADATRMVVLEGGGSEAGRLADSARRACWAAIGAARVGMRLGDLGGVIEESVARDGFHVIKEMSGHGVGRRIHEEPEVPNFDDSANLGVLEQGMVIAIEPILSVLPCGLRFLDDGWTVATDAGCLAGHYEETVLIGRGGAEVLTLCRG